MSAGSEGHPASDDHVSGLDLLGGFCAAAAIFLGGLALFLGIFVDSYRPVRMTIPAMILAFVAVAIGGRYSRLAAVSLIFAGAGFVLGLIVAIFVGKPIY